MKAKVTGSRKIIMCRGIVIGVFLIQLVSPAYSASAYGVSSDKPHKSDKSHKIADATELHILLCESSRAQVLDKLGLSRHEADLKERFVRYFDTTERSEFQRGVILRLREYENKTAEATVKIRVSALGLKLTRAMYNRLSEHDDFKCEEDRYLESSSVSCSMDSEVSSSGLQKFKRDPTQIRRLFSSDQKKMISEFGLSLPDFENLKSYGPILNEKIKFTQGFNEKKITLEIYHLDADSAIVELSRRSTPQGAETNLSRLKRYVVRKGLNICPEQIGKTRQVLEHVVPRSLKAQKFSGVL